MRERLIGGLLLLTLTVAGGCATTGAGSAQRLFFVPARDEGLYGTWVNKEYSPPGAAPKMSLTPWGFVEWFAAVDAADHARVGSSIIVERWVDERGDVWYRELRRASPGNSFADYARVLDRVSGDGQVLESVTGTSAWPVPSDLDPDRNPTYVRYLRLGQGRM